ncbi:MAG: hypothetical protein KatS3mg122_3195 [Caldimonas sp.]|nr:MAG: hypothetical protein KatS3mg122_3195 [Caldimonas sp.]
MQEGVELQRHEFAGLQQTVHQLAGIAMAGQAQAAGDPAQILVMGGQLVGLLIVEVLDAVFDPAQKDIGLGQLLRRLGLHHAHLGQAFEGAQRRAGADLGELAAAHDLQQLHDELDFSDAATRELHVIGALGPAGGAARGLFAHLAVQVAQALEHTVVEITAKDEGNDHIPQLQGPPRDHRGARGHHTAFEPGKALPLAALHEEIFLQHGQAHHGRAGHAIGSQGQIDTEDETILGGVADERVQAARHLREVFVCRDAAAPLRVAGGHAGFLVHVDQVDVGGNVELAPAELAHAHDPEVDALAGFVQRCAVALVLFGQSRTERTVERHFGQRGHRLPDLGHAGGAFDVEHGQPLQRELTRLPQGRCQRSTATEQGIDQGFDAGRVGKPRGQQAQDVAMATTHPLHEAGILGPHPWAGGGATAADNFVETHGPSWGLIRCLC